MASTPGWYFCLRCGAELPADARFCPVCGHTVGGVRPQSPAGAPLVEIGGDRLPLASVGKRLGALVVDWLILGVVFYALFFVVIFAAAIDSVDKTPSAPGLLISTGAFVAISLASSVLITLLSWGLDTFGWSPGKAATGIRAVRLDGKRPGLVHGLVRYSMRTVGILPLGLGYFWAIWDDRNQTWHDKLASAVVVQARPLGDRFPDRRPDPLVTRMRVWWLATIAAFLLTASAVGNVWWSSQFNGELFDEQYFDPQRFEEDRRVLHHPEVPEVVIVHLEDSWP